MQYWNVVQKNSLGEVEYLVGILKKSDYTNYAPLLFLHCSDYVYFYIGSNTQ